MTVRLSELLTAGAQGIMILVIKFSAKLHHICLQTALNIFRISELLLYSCVFYIHKGNNLQIKAGLEARDSLTNKQPENANKSIFDQVIREFYTTREDFGKCGIADYQLCKN